MRIRATVLSWQQGKALLQTASSACGTCNSHTSCSLKKTGSGQQHEIFIEQPVKPGQQIWLNINTGSLLYAGFIVYLVPLSGLILGGTGFQWLFFNDYLTVAGAFMGGAGGFLMARFLSTKYEKQIHCQEKIAHITAPLEDDEYSIKIASHIADTKAN